MTNETLAQYANLGVYSAMAVFTIAMIAFAIDLAGAAPRVLVGGARTPGGAGARRRGVLRQRSPGAA